MKDRVPGAPGQYQAVISAEGLQKMQAGEPFAITMTRDDKPIVEGTPYSKAAVLPDELAALICPDAEDPNPADAFAGLYEQINGPSKDNQILSESATGLGKDNIAGLLGYYYSAIDFEKKTVTLSETQDGAVAPAEPIAWEKGDVVSIVNGAKYELCATITAIDGNMITLDNIPFTSIVEDTNPNFDDWSISVPAKPSEGVADLGKCAVALGDGNKALNWAAFAVGRDNEVTSQYGFAAGRGNKVDGYGGFVTGKNNKIAPNCHFANITGMNNEVSGSAATAEGANNKASGNYSHAGGYNTKSTEDYQTVFGVNNQEDPNALFIIGNGLKEDGTVDYDNPSNAFVVKKDGTVVADGKTLVDKVYLGSTIWSKVDDSRVVQSGVALSTVMRSGFYKLCDTHPDMPDGCAWGQMIVSADSASQVQLVFPTDGKLIYHRRSTHGKYPSTWDSFSVSDADRPISTAQQAALDKKAPAGYGLGANSIWLSNDTDIDTLVKPGWYAYGADNKSQNKPATLGNIFVLARGTDKTCTQLACNRSTNTIKVRTMKDDVWNEWSTISFSGHTHAWSAITDKPTTFAPASHTHSDFDISVITDETTDFNSITNPGFYRCAKNAVAQDMPNTPTSKAFFMIVGKHLSGSVYQEVIEYQANSPKRYMRNYDGSEWGDWLSISFDGHTHSDYALKNHTHNNVVVNATPNATTYKAAVANYYILTIDYGGSLVTVPVAYHALTAGYTDYCVPVYVKVEGSWVSCELNVTVRVDGTPTFTAVSGTIVHIGGYN